MPPRPDPAKRGMDLLLTLAALPLMAAIAVWVRLDSPGPALFRQQRRRKPGMANFPAFFF